MICTTCKRVSDCQERRDPCAFYSPIFAYKFTSRPFKHQQRALDFAMLNNRIGLFMEMGTGKTKVILDYIVNNPQIHKVLILAPLSAVYVWVNEIYKHSPSLIKSACLIESKDEVKSKKRIHISNYEKVRVYLSEFIANHYDMIVCDESTKIKNIKALVTKRVCYLGRYVKHKFILTGTPVANNEMDLWSQFLFLDYGKTFGKSVYMFRKEFFEPDAFGFTWKIKPNAHEIIISRMKDNVVYVAKTECDDLPLQLYQKIDVPLTKTQRLLYEDMDKKFHIDLANGTHVTTMWVLAQMTFLQELACGFIRDPKTGLISEIENSKLRILSELLELLSEKKVVIWTRFLHSANKIIHEIGSKRKIYLYSSELNAEQREQNRKAFSEKAEHSILLASPAVGGMGIDLSCAHYAIYYSNSFSYIDREQSESRLHRTGQKNNVTYIDLVSRGTIEQTILDALKKKEDTLKSILGGLSNGT